MRKPFRITLKKEQEHLIREKIIYYRKKVLTHVKNPKLRSFIYGLFSFEMLFYMAFGAGTAFIDFSVFSILHAAGLNAVISNLFSTIAATIFAFVTNHRWVFKSETESIKETLIEFMHFSEVRLFTLAMSEIILALSDIYHGNGFFWKAVALILTIVINYLLSKLFIFNKKEN